MKEIFHINNTYFNDPLDFGDVTLLQLGRLYSLATTNIESMHGDLFELTVVLAGRGSVVTGESEASLSKGDIHLAGPHEYHAIHPHSEEPIRYDFFAFRVKDPATDAFLREAIRRRPTAAERILSSERIPSLIAEAIRELQGDAPEREALLRLLFAEIVLYLRRALTTPEREGLLGETDSQILCYQTMRYVDTHLETLRSLVEVADAFSYNYSYLSDLFHRVVGQTMSEYLVERRLEACRRALLAGDATVTAVAGRYGYPSLSSFSRAFKRRFGISPEQLRRQERGEKRNKKTE